MGDFFKLACERFSVRKFSAREVEAEKIQRIVEAGLRAPTACNLQPYRIWVVKSGEAREKALGAVPFPFVRDAPALLVVGASEQEGWVRKFDGKNFADIDAAIVATQMMLQIHDLGLGTTWIGHFDEKALKDSFEQMRGFNLIAIFPVGYIADDCEPAKGHTEKRPREQIVAEL
ncbi:MAG: nitroreductase family protein [Treponema sp.]|nr:nitroreductase family protein [Treponema sp.]